MRLLSTVMTVLDGFYDFFVSYASPYAPRSPSSSWNRESSWRGRRSSGGSSNNAWDTWSEEHKGGAGGGSQQWGGGRGEPWSAGRHGRITQRESVDEDRNRERCTHAHEQCSLSSAGLWSFLSDYGNSGRISQKLTGNPPNFPQNFHIITDEFS